MASARTARSASGRTCTTTTSTTAPLATLARPAYYEENRERLQVAARVYEKAHRAERNAARNAWKAANAERARASNRAYYAANRERLAAYKRAYNEANRDAIRERRRAWQRVHAQEVNAANRRSHHKNKHLGKYRVRIIRRRALEYAAEGSFTVDDVRALYAAQAGLCAYCSIDLNATYHVDHMQPLSRGGSNFVANLALACPKCNCSKRDKTAEEFRALRNASPQ